MENANRNVSEVYKHHEGYFETWDRLQDQKSYDRNGIVKDVVIRLCEVVDGEAQAVLELLYEHWRNRV